MDQHHSEAAETPAPEPVSQESFDERLAKSVEAQIEKAGAAEESAPDDAVAAEEPAETTVDEPKSEPDPEPFPAEQMADDAFFDKLDKDGWARLEKLHPALYKMGKAVASARGKAFARLKNLPPESSPEPRTDDKPKISEPMRAAILKSQSWDTDEAAEGLREVARLTLQEERAAEREAETKLAERAQHVLTNAYAGAVKTLPAIAKIADEDLEAAVKADPALTRMLQVASKLEDDEERIFMTENVMIAAGRAVLGKRAADEQKVADSKKSADQARIRAAQNAPSNHLVDTPAGKGAGGAKSFDKDGMAFINSQLVATGTPQR